jgi:sterol desaturase/sphingolipid hydroxylase (fatty acid hydroxylase superfamily)
VALPREEFFRVPLITLPLNLLFGLSIPQTAVAVGLMLVATQITHANTRIGFGPFRYILSEPMYHRIHHSVVSGNIGTRISPLSSRCGTCCSEQRISLKPMSSRGPGLITCANRGRSDSTFSLGH